MKALLCKAFGPPETLVVEDVPSPRPGPGEVVIDVKAAGVNFPDVLIIQDKYQFKPPLPFAPGGEVAGVVKAVGAGVTHVKPGDRVIAIVGLRRVRRGGASSTRDAADPHAGRAWTSRPPPAFTLTYGTS